MSRPLRSSLPLHPTRRRRSPLPIRYLSTPSASAVRQHVETLTPPPTPTPPTSSSPLSHQLSTVRSLLSQRRRLLCLTGAGLSTESGIPDYRSPGRPPHNPITHQTFMQHPFARQRYWARSMIGYARMTSAQPNPGHVALADAQRRGRVTHIVTQNVDELHEKAGAQGVVHLHGNIHHVECQQCKTVTPRSDLQAQLEQLNPAFTQHIKSLLQQAQAQFEQQQLHRSTHISTTTALPPAALIPHNHDEDAPIERSMAALRPDGDIELQNEEFYQHMRIPPCAHCGGILKPMVVFFGANVRKEDNARVDAMLADADAVLVVGTSLTVWSAFRIVKAALSRSTMASDARPAVITSTGPSPSSHLTVESAAVAPCLVAILNDGPTRADPLITPDLRIAARTGATLHSLLS